MHMQRLPCLQIVMMKVSFRIVHPDLLRFSVIVMMRFLLRLLCCPVPPPPPVSLFASALARRLVAVPDTLSMVSIDLLLLHFLLPLPSNYRARDLSLTAT
jgi:hypothetical protein